jgi:amino acid adenylation domain-containing protein
VKKIDDLANKSFSANDDITLTSKEEEIHKILYEWNNTNKDYPKDKTIIELFTEQAHRTPDKIALVFEDNELTYKELNAQVNQLAHAIRHYYQASYQHDMPPDTLIALFLDRSIEMLVSILAVLKAGGAYVPMSPDSPSSRTEFILTDTNAPIVISQPWYINVLSKSANEINRSVIFLNANDKNFLNEFSTDDLSVYSGPHDLAYVIYTSGTTGKPKGVMMEHASIVNRVTYMVDASNILATDRYLFKINYIFDASVADIFTHLTCGACLYIAKNIIDDTEISKILNTKKCNSIHLVPSQFSVLVDVLKNSSIKKLYLSGEKLLKNIFTSFASTPQIYNYYGPTEVGDISCYKPKDENDISCIGRSFHNTHFYVLNEKIQPVPIGEVGELYIGGIGLARGYLNREELTRSKFIDNPFQTKAEKENGVYAKLYKTGDLVRWLSDGNIEYLGRNDFQLKIRGFRVELGEIESIIEKYAGVKHSVVIAKPAPSGDLYLIGYYVAANKLNEEQLFKHIVDEVADYMVPSKLVYLDKLPLTINGKLDRDALPEVVLGSGDDYVGPANLLEQQVTDIWAKVLALPIDKVGVATDFFRLGGNSLLAIKLINQINSSLGIKLNVLSLFAQKTIRQLCLEINDKSKNNITIDKIIVNEPAEQRLSFGQERLWFMEQYEGGTSINNIALCYQIAKDIDITLLKASIRDVITRHEVLHSYIKKDSQGNGYQVAIDIDKNPIPIQYSEVDNFNLLQSKFIENKETIFQLSSEYPLRINIYKYTKTGEYYLNIVVHHIAFDGWSIDILSRDIESYYYAHKNGVNSNPLPKFDIQYKDFALWQKTYLGSKKITELLEFWTKQLSNYNSLNLITDKVRPAKFDYRGADINFTISEQVSIHLKELAKACGVSLYSVLLTAYLILLKIYSGQDDIILGTLVANRQYSQIAELIGFFVNSLALRLTIDTDKSLESLIKQVGTVVINAQLHQELPFEKLVDALNLPKDTSRPPLFQVQFNMQSFGNTDNGLLKPYNYDTSSFVANYDLGLFIDDSQPSLKGRINYATSLYEIETINRYVETYQLLLKQIASIYQGNHISQTNISDLKCLSDACSRRLLEDWNSTDNTYPSDKTIHELFEAQVERTPNHIAIICEGKEITYSQLNKAANQVAHYLKKSYQVEADTLIALCLDRSEALLTVLLGILKAGAAYVPIDPMYPEARISYLLEKTQPVLLFSEEKYAVRFKWQNIVIIDSNEFQQACAKLPIDNPCIPVKNTDLAYVVYTSGTTGQPKGVMIEHQAIINRLYYFIDTCNIDSKTKILSKTAYVFDASCRELYSALLSGAQLILLNEAERKSPHSIIQAIEKYRVDLILFVPSQLRYFNNYIKDENVEPNKLTSLKFIYVSGEILQKSDVNAVHEYLPDVVVKNQFGSTECCMIQFESSIQSKQDKPITIGKPIANVKAYVLDKTLNLLPVGGVGELYIGGLGLSRGYLNQQNLTKASFIKNPFQTTEEQKAGVNSRLYKTGDLVRWLADGNLDYLGRNDSQLKIRGLRVDPAEIEGTINLYQGIKQSVLQAKAGPNGDLYLVGYYVADEKLDEAKILEYLAKHLPNYMVPSVLVYMQELPLNINGKIDKFALPAVELTNDLDYVSPQDDIEYSLIAIWSRVLSLPSDKIGVQTSFFRLGGNSLLAIKLASQINHSLGIKLSVLNIFTAPTIRQLSGLINSNHQADSTIKKIPINKPEEQKLSFGQERIWFIEQYHAGTSAYNIPMCFEIGKNIDIIALKNSIIDVIDRHEILHSVIKKDVAGNGYQVVLALKDNPIDITYEEIKDLKLLHTKLTTNALKIMNLSEDYPLLIAIYMHEKTGKHYLNIVVHHIAFDGWSTDILMRDIESYYEYHVNKINKVSLPKLEIQYKDFALWERNYLDNERLATQLSYWQEKLHNYQPLTLPIDKIRPVEFDYQGADILFIIDEEISANLREIAKACGVSLFSVLLAAYFLLLQSYSGQDDLVLGTSIANRHHNQIESLIGFFVNSLVLRLKIDKKKSLESFIKEVGELVIAAHLNQEFPFEKLVDALKIPIDTSRHPLFQILFSVQSFGNEASNILKPYYNGLLNKAAKYDLSLFIDDSQKNLQCRINYATSLYREETIKGYIETYQILLEQFSTIYKTANIATLCTGELRYLTSACYQAVVYKWNETSREYPVGRTIQEVFEAQVACTPDRIAISFKDKQINYQQLNEAANRLAHYIRDHHLVSRGMLIGLCLDRSEMQLIGLLAILKAGAAYLPIDPTYPRERIAYLLNDSQASLVLTQEKYASCLEQVKAISLDSSEFQHKYASYPNLNPKTSTSSTDVAYVIYTSGTTGKPKGVIIQHDSVINYINNLAEKIYAGPDQLRIDFSTNIAFDLSISTTLGGLLAGACICIYDKEVQDLNSYIAHLIKNNINVVKQVPSYFELVIDALVENQIEKISLTSVILGGEKLSSNLLEKIFIKLSIKIYDEYGPTETTVGSHIHMIDSLAGIKDHNLGHLYNNYTGYVLSPDLKPLPIGAVGELYIGGRGVARGYLNQPQLTLEKFIQNPFQSKEDKRNNYNQRLYKTGDLVKYLPNGELEYINRNDFQLKINGYRIELDEIEKIISAYENIKRSIVIPVDKSMHLNFNNPEYLLAYYLSEHKLDEDEILHYLKKILPSYMLPKTVIHIQELPLTSNGKIDKHALPKYEFNRGTQYSGPRSATEVILEELWSEVLSIKDQKIGIDDDFFSLGGNSILAIKLVSRMNSKLKSDLKVFSLFTNGTIRKISKLLDEATVIAEGEIV